MAPREFRQVTQPIIKMLGSTSSQYSTAWLWLTGANAPDRITTNRMIYSPQSDPFNAARTLSDPFIPSADCRRKPRRTCRTERCRRDAGSAAGAGEITPR